MTADTGGIEPILNHIALDAAVGAGARYAEARFVRIRVLRLSCSAGAEPAVATRGLEGIAVRASRGGVFGSASTTARTHDAAASCGREAAELAPPGTVPPAETPPTVATWSGDRAVDPWSAPVDDVVALLGTAVAAADRKGVAEATAFAEAVYRETWFASTSGADLRLDAVQAGGAVTASAAGDDGVATRSYPDRAGAHAVAGWEWVQSLGLEAAAERVGAEAVAFAHAPPAPAGPRTIVLRGNQLALQLHESIGHALELDRIMGAEQDYAGGSFVTPGDVGSLRYASPAVTVEASSLALPAAGCAAFDDEGNAASRLVVVDRGRLTGLVGSRSTAAAAPPGLPVFLSARSDGLGPPLVRMAALSLLPGDGTEEDVVAGVRDGLLIDGTRSFSIDDRRDRFFFGCEAAWEIRNGRVGRPVRGPVYTGRTLDFWRSCRAVAGAEEHRPWSVSYCSKGSPVQVVPVGHWASVAAFDSVETGASGT